MWCFRAKRWLSAYLDDELNENRRASLEKHLETCDECAAELARLRSQWGEPIDLGDVPPLPTDLWVDILHKLDEAEQVPWYCRRRKGFIRATAVIACVLLGFLAGALLSWRAPTVQSEPSHHTLSEERLFVEAFEMPALVLSGAEEGQRRCGNE